MKRKSLLLTAVFAVVFLTFVNVSFKRDDKALNRRKQVQTSLIQLELDLLQQQHEITSLLDKIQKVNIEHERYNTQPVILPAIPSTSTNISLEIVRPGKTIGSLHTNAAVLNKSDELTNQVTTAFNLTDLLKVDKRWWLGINAVRLSQRYPGIALNPGYRLVEYLEEEEDGGDASDAGRQVRMMAAADVTDYIAEIKYYRFISSRHVQCSAVLRVGNYDDGGWTLCNVPPYIPEQDNCIVYSFGINNDFSFDDHIASKFGCEVFSFDPSMSVGDHDRSAHVHFYQLGLGSERTVTDIGWRLDTLQGIMDKLGHLQTTIDVVKIDIDYSEWECLRTMLRDGVLRRVRQLVLEVHTSEIHLVNRPSIREDFADMYAILLELEKVGFRRHHHHVNPTGMYTSLRSGQQQSCCYDLSYINIHFLKPSRLSRV